MSTSHPAGPIAGRILLRGICGILFGVLTFIWPGISLVTLVLLYGAYALVDGVLALIAAIKGEAPAPALAQLIWGPWQVNGDFFGTSGTSVNYKPSDEDPFYKLPVLKVLGSVYVKGGMTLALKVVQDYLK